MVLVRLHYLSANHPHFRKMPLREYTRYLNFRFVAALHRIIIGSGADAENRNKQFSFNSNAEDLLVKLLMMKKLH
jgi:hypothetical protein